MNYFFKLRRNSHEIHHLKGNSWVAFSIFTCCTTITSGLLPEHPQCPKRYSIPSSPSPWKPRVCFLSLWICLFWTFHMDVITPQCGLLRLAYLTQHSISMVYPCYSMCSCVIPCYGWIIFLSRHGSHFIYSLIRWGTRGYFYLLVIVTGAAVNMHVHVFIWTPAFPFFGGYILWSEISGSYSNLFYV